MRIILALLLSVSITLYGWPGSLSEHAEEQCHIDEGKHHNEALGGHVNGSDDHCAQESHDSEEDCQPEHCSDHCNLCHVAMIGFIGSSADGSIQRMPYHKEHSKGQPEKLTSVLVRPDTPPPKA